MKAESRFNLPPGIPLNSAKNSAEKNAAVPNGSR